jgi:hypothetical protein
MSETKETLPNIQYETPDQLIEALRFKSNDTLADTVDKIAKKVKGTSKDWREALKDELT